MSRSLASIRRIDEIKEHGNADALELARVDGWQVVVKKNEFKPGDPVVFFEIDSFLPADDERFEFLKKSGVKTLPNGEQRIRLKTVKLRKEISQGLCIPLREFPELRGHTGDVTEILNVTKYERPEPKHGDAAGRFPSWIQKTDQERVQNIHKKLDPEAEYVPTLKLDGSSITMAFVHNDIMEEYGLHWEEGEDPKALNVEDGQFQIASRNLYIKYNEDNHFWRGFLNEPRLMEFLRFLYSYENVPSVLQGELMGPGIQGNKEKFNDYRIFIFDEWIVDERKYREWDILYDAATILNCSDLLVSSSFTSQYSYKPGSMSIDEILGMSDGPSINAKYREGIVWKPLDEGQPSFKSISNKFLLKGGDD